MSPPGCHGSLSLAALLLGAVAVGCAGGAGDRSDTRVSDESVTASPIPFSEAPAVAHANADAALQTMLLRYWRQGDSYLAASYPYDGSEAGYWIFAQAFDATVDGLERSGGARFVGTVETLYEAQNAKGWSRDYYDDENWAALTLIRAYQTTHVQKYLTTAISLFEDIMRAWDTTCCGAEKGGLWWDKSHTQKATASNAGAVVTGSLLYEMTKNASYLSFAEKAFAFWSAHMVDPKTHHVFDHMLPNGSVVDYRFTYNEGLMIAAGQSLARASGNASSLALAQLIAEYMVQNEVTTTAAGPVLFDGTSARCGGDCSQFKGIGYRYLAALYAAEPSNADYARVLGVSAHAVTTTARGSSGLFAIDWTEAQSGPTLLSSDNSAVQALGAFAALMGPRPADPDPAAYQAEEGVLHGLGLEASNHGYQGWGYVAGWGGDGQWLDFYPTVSATGNYDIQLRYASPAGGSRLIFVNGANAVKNQPFAATTAWTTYSQVTATVHLNAGKNTLSVIFNEDDGSRGFINLDQIRVTAH